MAAPSSLIVHAHTYTARCMSLEVLSSDVLLPGPEALQEREQLTGLREGEGSAFCCLLIFGGGDDGFSPVAGCGLVENGRQEVQE